MTRVFIDGKEGTTGLRIFDRLEGRDDIELLTLGSELRKDKEKRREMLNSADIVFLCLPDDAAREAISMITALHVRVIDASTAHRTAPGWVYGFPELYKNGREMIASAARVAVPGCHAGGFNALVYPLIEAGLVGADYPFVCYSVTGYSGGGRKMIETYKSPVRPAPLFAPRQYALGQQHKHLPEMKAVSGLSYFPVFSPIVADYYSGMEVTVPIITRLTGGTDLSAIREVYKNKYAGGLVRYRETKEAMLSANLLSGYDEMEITVCGNEDRVLAVALFDNLGKGASGAAVQCMNLMIGADEQKGLLVRKEIK